MFTQQTRCTLYFVSTLLHAHFGSQRCWWSYFMQNLSLTVEYSLIETSFSFTLQINFLALAVRDATSDCFPHAAERWGGSYLFSNVSSYALETRQLGRNGSIRNAGGRACFLQRRSLFLQSCSLYFMRQKLGEGSSLYTVLLGQCCY